MTGFSMCGTCSHADFDHRDGKCQSHGCVCERLTPPRPVVDLRGEVAVSLRKTPWGNLSEDHRG
jgi:hypothetical protein